jgi:hypothetical protein
VERLSNCAVLDCVEANDRLSGESLRSARNRRSSNVSQEGYGTSAVLPERGIYLTSAVYRPILQVCLSVLSSHARAFLVNARGQLLKSYALC